MRRSGTRLSLATPKRLRVLPRCQRAMPVLFRRHVRICESRWQHRAPAHIAAPRGSPDPLLSNFSHADTPPFPCYRFLALHLPHISTTSHVTKHAMYGRHLEVIELREKAFAARERAEKARRLAARTFHKPASFDHYAAELDARAMTLEQRIEQLRAKR